MNSSSRLARSLRSPRAILGLLLTSVVLLAAVFAAQLAPHPPEQQAITLRLKPPAWVINGLPEYPLGTDHLGRDLFSRLVFGARTSLVIAGISVILTSIVGITLGLVAGYFGGMPDLLISRLVELQLAFPVLLLAIIMMTVLRPSVQSVVIVLVISGWATYARLIRGQVLSLREREYILSARALGCSETWILVRHILPNLIPLVLIVATTQVSQFILTESSLSFLGLGINPPTPSWGNIIQQGQEYLLVAWWIETFPGIAIVMTVSGIGLLGDWLRDYLDPRLAR